MTINDIKIAMNTSQRLYINSEEIEVVFLEELTETIEVKFSISNQITYVTKSAITNIPLKKISVRINEFLIIDLGGDNNVQN